MSALSFLLLAAGCHLFESVQVECTSDMPCAGEADTDTDTDADGDTDTDTDTDTGPQGEPRVGWVTSLAGGGKSLVRVFDPVTGEVGTEWSFSGEFVGAPYYEPSSGAGLLVGVGGFYTLGADGAVQLQGEGPGSDQFDITHLGGLLLAAYQGGLTWISADLSVNEEVVPSGTLDEIRFVGGSADIAYFVDPSAGGPDLWKIDPTGAYSLVAADYDTSLTRASNIFVGPDGEPYGCSRAGAVYSLAALSGGDSRPAAYYDNGFDDVSDCAWDAGDSSFLLFSASKGVFRIDTFGRAEQVSVPSTGYTYGRVHWYGN